MKYLKMLGLAAVAAAALMAFVGASSASATVLCKTKPTGGETGTQGTTCPAGWAYEKGTVMHAVNVGKITLETPFITIACEASTIQGVTQNEGSATEVVNVVIEGLTFEKCNCEVVVVKKGTQKISWRADTFNSPILSSGQEVTATCNTIFGKMHCIYVASETEFGEITGGVAAGEGAKSDVNATVPRLTTNADCEEQALWKGTYEFTSPKPLYIASHT